MTPGDGVGVSFLEYFKSILIMNPHLRPPVSFLKGREMGNFTDLEKTREYFKNDRFATDNGMQIDEVCEEYVVCSLVLGEGHKNANGGIMGGVIFTLADFAFAVLANSIHLPTVAQQVSINFLGAPKGEKLFAKSTCRKSGKNSTVIIVDVTDDTGRDVAQFVGTGFKLGV